MAGLKNFARRTLIAVLGEDARPRRILFGLAAGCRIHASPTTNLGYIVGTSDWHLQRAIKRYVSPGDVVYDIGANMGYISLMLAKRVCRDGRVFAFEPAAEAFELLQLNVSLNRLANVKLLNAAAADRAGQVSLRVTGNLSMSSIVWHGSDPSATAVTVPTVAIDDLIDDGELLPPKFIKIDVEGAEGMVLQGMKRTIASQNPVIFLECSDVGRELTWPLLRNAGYRCQSAHTREWVETFDKYRHADFLWLPRSNARI